MLPTDFPLKNDKGNKPICETCGEPGYTSADCWENNRDKAPNWLKEKRAKKEKKGDIKAYNLIYKNDNDEIRPSLATYQPQEGRRHNIIRMNQSLRSSNGGHANTCHSVPSSEIIDGESGVTYSVVKRSAKVIYSSNQHRLRLDKLAAIEAAIMLDQDQPRCRFCFNTSCLTEQKTNTKRNGIPLVELLNVIGKIMDATRESKTVTIDSTTSDSSMKPFPRYKINPSWRSPRISGSVLQRCTICGDDFLDLSRHTKCSPCGSDHQCPVCELRFNDSRKLDDHIKRHDLHREMIHCPEKDCNKLFATKQGLDEHIQCIHQGKKRICPCCHKTFHYFGVYFDRHLRTHFVSLQRRLEA